MADTQEDILQYDLLPKLSPFLDRHMILKILDFFQDNKIYPQQEVITAKIQLLTPTNTLDYISDLHKEIGKEVPAEIEARRAQIVEKGEKLIAEAQPIFSLVAQPDEMKALLETPNLKSSSVLSEKKITEVSLKALFDLAKWKFEGGDYPAAAQHLTTFRELSSDTDLCNQALWGRLATNIIMEQWKAAMGDFLAVKDIVEARAFVNPALQLQQKTWLLHWSLPIFFNFPESRSTLFEVYVNTDRTWPVIQTTCPHLLRYLVAAIVLTKRHHYIPLKEFLRVLDQENYNYSDPFTKFLEATLTQLDFQAAETQLAQCDKVLLIDPYLKPIRDEFLATARLLVFEQYCKLHSCIDIPQVANKFGLAPADAEKWIINLFRDGKLDAKIDSQSNLLVGSQPVPIYQQILKTTKYIMPTRPGGYKKPHRNANTAD